MNNRRLPRISVIIRSFNSSAFIRNAITSALNQTIARDLFEIILIDDGSTDDSEIVLEEFNKEVTQFKKEHTGPIGAANLGITRSKGELVTLLDSDDQFEPQLLEELLGAVDKCQTDFSYCDYYERHVGEKEKRIISLKDNIFESVAMGILFKKSIILEVGGYDEDFLFPEYDLLIRILKNGYRGTHVPLPLFTYNRRESSLTANQEYVKRGFKQLFDKYGKIEGLREY